MLILGWQLQYRDCSEIRARSSQLDRLGCVARLADYIGKRREECLLADIECCKIPFIVEGNEGLSRVS